VLTFCLLTLEYNKLKLAHEAFIHYIQESMGIYHSFISSKMDEATMASALIYCLSKKYPNYCAAG
jgi:hypothetical protein